MKMNLFPGHPQIETSRYVLRPPREDEIDALFYLGLSFWGGKPAETLEIGRDSIRKTAAEFTAGRCLHWVAEAKDGGAVVGSVGFYRGFDGEQGEIGYVMNAEYRGRGIMSELLSRAVAFGHGEKGLKRIIAVTHSENIPSLALLTKAGFVFETARENGFHQYGRGNLLL